MPFVCPRHKRKAFFFYFSNPKRFEIKKYEVKLRDTSICASTLYIFSMTISCISKMKHFKQNDRKKLDKNKRQRNIIIFYNLSSCQHETHLIWFWICSFFLYFFHFSILFLMCCRFQHFLNLDHCDKKKTPHHVTRENNKKMKQIQISRQEYRI